MYKTIAFFVFAAALAACSTSPSKVQDENFEQITTSPFDGGKAITITFEKGKEYYYPLIAIWIEDEGGKYIETLYASKSIATGIYRYGVNDKGKWKAGERRRAAALPYWGHKRGYKAPDGLYLPTPENPLPDAISGATPKTSFVIKTNVNSELKKFKVFMEINQTWDWNNYWHNNRFPDDEEYKTSCQPALVYSAVIDFSNTNTEFELKPIGHSHPSGKTGELFPDLSGFTTALEITKKVTVKI
jgi:hypothetical protein